MSKKHRTPEGFEGYLRCGVCDYSEMNAELYPFTGWDRNDMRRRRGRDFSYDKHRDEYVCSECREAIHNCLSEFDYDEGKDPSDLELEDVLKEYGLDDKTSKS